MATEKRERQRANRQLKQEQQVQEEKRDKYRQYIFLGVIIAVALIGGLALLSLTGGDDTETVTPADTPADEVSADDSAEAADPAGDDSAAGDDGETDEALLSFPCPNEDGSSEQVLEFPSAPQSCLDPDATYTAVFDTNLGTIRAELDAEKAPETVNNFVYLARYHYYDGTAFHRIISDFMIQGGDPTGNPPGTGGPGYTIDEETPDAGEYQIGSLAMAKRNEASTTGAQFFIVTGPNGEALPPLYSLFGQVTEGLDVVQAIEAQPTDGSDYPIEEVIVNTVTIEQSA